MNHPPPDRNDPATARFVAHVLGMSEQALIFLGHAPDPVDGTQERRLPMAREAIDHLEMLESKTRGNLGGEEARLLRDVLTRLRLAYAEASSRPEDDSAARHPSEPAPQPSPAEPADAPEPGQADPKISGDPSTERRRFHKTYD